MKVAVFYLAFLLTATNALESSASLLSETTNMSIFERKNSMLALAQTTSSAELQQGTKTPVQMTREPTNWSWISHDPNDCLKVRSLNFRADVIYPIAGPSMII